jgi:hypothetical protein
MRGAVAEDWIWLFSQFRVSFSERIGPQKPLFLCRVVAARHVTINDGDPYEHDPEGSG